MNRKAAIALVEEMLALYARKDFDTVSKLMLYQRGYLTGILADLIRTDFYAEHIVKEKIKKAKKK